MKPMPNWSNGLVYYTEDDIRVREFLISEISNRLRSAMQELNNAIRFVRVETPCIVPHHIVKQHCDANFPLWKIDEQLYLRPESTKGTYEMFPIVVPQKTQLKKRLPLCLWQSSLSFRVEQDKSFNNLRFKQFYQLEFQLAYAENTQADYHSHAVVAMQQIIDWLFHRDTRTEILTDDKPFYSQKTTDIYLDQWEIIAISSRTDFEYPILEVSCGLDRLTAIYQRCVYE